MKIGYDYWQDKSINCLGDSITWGAGNNCYGWVEFLREAFPQAKIHSHAVSGSTVAVCPKRKEAPFVERFEEMDKSAELTIIFGGVNDFINSVPLGKRGDGRLDSFCGAMEHMILKWMEYDPAGQLLLLTPMRVNGFRDFPSWYECNDDGHVLKDYRDALLELAEYYAVPVLDLFREGMINAETPQIRAAVLPDGLHPSALGHERIARRVAAKILTL